MKRVLGLILLAVVGCGKDDFNGSYVGQEQLTRNGQVTTAAVTVTLTANGDVVTGNFSSQSGSSGTLGGVRSGNQINNFIVSIPQSEQCGGQLSGNATIDSGTLTATLSGQTRCGNISSSVVLRKQ